MIETIPVGWGLLGVSEALGGCRCLFMAKQQATSRIRTCFHSLFPFWGDKG